MHVPRLKPAPLKIKLFVCFSCSDRRRKENLMPSTREEICRCILFVAPLRRLQGALERNLNLLSLLEIESMLKAAGSKRGRAPSKWTGSISPAARGVKDSGHTINCDKLPASYTGRCDKNGTEHQHLGGRSAFFLSIFVGCKRIVKSTMKS